MRFLVLLLSLPSLGCSKAVSSLEETFGTDRPAAGADVPVGSVSITGQTRKDFTVFKTGAKLSLNADAAIIELPGVKTLVIPSSKIAGCTMVCSGGEKWDVDLLIPETGTSLAFEHSKALYEWCWSNKLPMVSGEATRNWLYLKKPLPDRESLSSVVASRTAYDKQAKLACNGY